MKAVRAVDTPWLAALCVAVLYLGVLVMQLSAHDHDVSYFIAVGDRYIREPDKLRTDVHILSDSSGYDGQFSYQLALNPFSPQEVNAGLSISNGPYRHQRIIYPLLAWLLAFSRQSLVPATLAIVNYLALCAIAWLGARFAQLHNRHALWGVFFAFYPGFLFTLTRDLTEIVAVMFLLAAVIALHTTQSSLLAVLPLTLAVLTRETALIAVIALAITLVRPAMSRWTWLPAIAVPFACYGLWQVALWSKWGQVPVLAGAQNLGFPGQGLLAFVNSLEAANVMHRIWSIELAFMAFITGVVVLVALRAPNVPAFPKLAWFGYLLLALCLTPFVWVEDIAFMRAMSELYLFSLILIIAAVRSPGLVAAIASSTVVTWILVFFNRLDW